ncbi:hypothetical protein NUM3379_14560 [Kineococcus sp. NUM-3379]
MAVLTLPVERAPGVVAAALSLTGAALLAVRALGLWESGPVTSAAAVPLAAAAALLAVAAAASALRGRRAATVLAGLAVACALAVDTVPAAPPRLLPLLPLAVATALLAAAPRATSTARSPWALALGWMAIAAHTAVGFGYLLLGLVVPWYGLAVLWAVWAGLLVLAVRLLRERPAWALAVPPVAVVTAVGVVLVGEHLLGWMP